MDTIIETAAIIVAVIGGTIASLSYYFIKRASEKAANGEEKDLRNFEVNLSFTERILHRHHTGHIAHRFDHPVRLLDNE